MERSRLSVFITVLMFFVVLLPLSAIEIKLVYIEGRLEYREGRDTWTPMEIGDLVPEGRTVRLSGRGFAEFSSGERRVTLTRDGIYESSELFREVDEQSGFFKAIGGKFSMLRNRPEPGNAVAAVRASEAQSGVDDFISWEDEYDSPLEKGLALYFDGDYAGARAAFDEGIISESGAVQRECSFRKALCQLNLGEPREARRTLTNLSPEPDDPYIDEYTVLTASLYLESMDYSGADAVLASYLNDHPRGDAAQASWMLSAYSLEAQGKIPESRASLTKAVELGPDTEIGRAASDKLRQ